MKLTMLSPAMLSLLLHTTSTAAQTVLVYGTNDLPTCAQGCTLLTNAQAACVPPAAPVTNQATYESCFCQSGYLSTLSTSTSGICDTVCDTTDVTQIQSWYVANCKNDGADVAATASTSATTTPSSTSNVATAGATTSGTSSSASGVTPVTGAEKGSWWSNHWKWVLMIIIIAIGLLAIALIGVLLRRRYHRKQDRITSTFNRGITARATPMTSIPPGKNYVYNMDGAAGSDRLAPSVPNEYGIPTRGDSRQTSQSYLPRVREKDRTMVRQEPFPEYGEEMDAQRGGTPLAAAERGQAKLTKGKGRM